MQAEKEPKTVNNTEEAIEKFTPENVQGKLSDLKGDNRKFLEDALNKEGSYEIDQITNMDFLSTLDEEQFKKILSMRADLVFHTDLQSKKEIAKQIAQYLATV